MLSTASPSAERVWIMQDHGDLVSPEFIFLLTSCRSHLFARRGCTTEVSVHQSLNWDLVINLATAHSLLPLLYTQLKQQSPAAVPPEITALLHQAFQDNLQQTLNLTAELLKITQSFQQAGIQVLAFKGPTLAQQIYGNVALRQFLDIDLLVPEAQVVAASQWLIQAGYESQFDFSVAQHAQYMEIRDEHYFWHEEKQVSVDLHWSIQPRNFTFSYNAEEVWPFCEWVPFANVSVPTLGKSQLLAYLCAHGAKHNWSHLCWVVDLAALIQHSPDLDWHAIQALAGRLGSRRMLYLGLSLAQQLMGIELPVAIAHQIQADPAVHRLAKTVIQRYCSPRLSWAETQLDDIYLGAMDHWRDRLFFRWDQIFTPTPLEWNLLPLPRSLHVLYYGVRLSRLVSKYGKRGMRLTQPHPPKS